MLTARHLRSRLLKRADVNDHIRHEPPPLEVLMARKVDPKVDEAIETLNLRDSPTRRRLHRRRRIGQRHRRRVCPAHRLQFVEQRGRRGKRRPAPFPSTPSWQFWFVNHVTTNPFFVPTQYGMADCAKLLGLPVPKWTGSANSVASQMVRPDQRGGGGQGGRDRDDADRLHLVHDAGRERDERRHPRAQLQRGRQRHTRACPTSAPTGSATSARRCTRRASSSGERIKQVVPTPGEVVIFIATPGQANIQPRYDGAASVLDAARLHGGRDRDRREHGQRARQP